MNKYDLDNSNNYSDPYIYSEGGGCKAASHASCLTRPCAHGPTPGDPLHHINYTGIG